jgi:hypothetical protein
MSAYAIGPGLDHPSAHDPQAVLERGAEVGHIGALGYNPSPGGACTERLCPLGQA